jgi:hypothetical protein
LEKPYDEGDRRNDPVPEAGPETGGFGISQRESGTWPGDSKFVYHCQSSDG